MAHNLLLNALVHGLADGPVSCVATVDGAELVVQVWNDGNPLSTTALKKVFDPFWRQHPKSTGPNLGLHMCSEIVRAHSGRLVASSSPTDGTLFVARIPVNA